MPTLPSPGAGFGVGLLVDGFEPFEEYKKTGNGSFICNEIRELCLKTGALRELDCKFTRGVMARGVAGDVPPVPPGAG